MGWREQAWLHCRICLSPRVWCVVVCLHGRALSASRISIYCSGVLQFHYNDNGRIQINERMTIECKLSTKVLRGTNSKDKFWSITDRVAASELEAVVDNKTIKFQL